MLRYASLNTSLVQDHHLIWERWHTNENTAFVKTLAIWCVLLRKQYISVYMCLWRLLKHTLWLFMLESIDSRFFLSRSLFFKRALAP